MRLLAALFAIASLPVAEGAAVSRDWNANPAVVQIDITAISMLSEMPTAIMCA